MKNNERYVIGMDSSTQSVKAIAWTAAGTPVCEGRAPHTLLTPDAFRAEEDPAEWWTAAQTALRAVTAQVDPARIDGIAISNQRETMAILDKDGVPAYPAMVWLDRRARETPPIMAEEFGRERLHRITGKPIDVIPCVYRLRWLRDNAPEVLEKAAHILSVHDFLTWKLTGTPAATWTSADPFGLFDIAEKRWSRPILDHLGLSESLFPTVHRPASPVGAISQAAAELTGLRAGTPVFAGGGDGHCAALGVGAIGNEVIYLNLGTAVVGGMWSPTPDVSNYWRTNISPTGVGYVLESCQRAGAIFVNWLVDNFAGGGRAEGAIFSRLEAEAAALPVGANGVLACTYLFGSMDPHWDQEAKATFTGLSVEHGIGHLYRASLEAITLEFVRSLAEMRKANGGPDRIFAIGGGANSPLWRKMIADSSGLPVHRSLSNEASALGAGMSAAVGAGWFGSFAEAVSAMSQTAEQTDPDPRAADVWADLSARQAQVYLNNA